MLPHPPPTIVPPELLAPAGDWDCVRAAVENGADAIYFGLDDGFNARVRAANFELDRMPELMSFLHQRGVKGYVTLNTLAFSDELPQVEFIARSLASAAVDAVLVQDIGVARLVRRICPELTLHASTQMTMTSAECIEVIAELGIERVVLARELSIAEIRDIRTKTSIPLEAFVHGALCVAYSGQCLTSESLGGRSANRGQCAQACRLPYELVCDGELRDLGDQKYLLSPQDLAAFELTADLVDAGVCSFKIEGRLKTPEYVANMTRHYREAIDAVMAGRPIEFSRRQVQQMEQSFSRGFSPGWLKGCDHKMLVPATSSSKRGVLLGEVVRVQRDRVSVQLQYVIAAGDGIVFEGDRTTSSEQGGRVYDVFVGGTRQSEPVDSGVAELTFDHRAIDLTVLSPGLKIYKTDDPRLNRQLRRTFDSADPQRRVALDVQVRAEVGQPLVITGTTTTGSHCHVVSEQPLEAARKHPLTDGLLREQLSRLGATIYELRSLDSQITGQPMLPLSVLGTLRRQMIEQLDRGEPATVRNIAKDPVLPQLRAELPARESATSAPMRLTVMTRSLDQLRGLTDWLQTSSSNADSEHGTVRNGRPKIEAIADFQDIREFREAVSIARAASLPLLLATPRIQKPDEMGIFRLMLKPQPDGILVRNLSGMKFFVDHRNKATADGDRNAENEGRLNVVGDFSLNVTNELTAAFLMSKGLNRITASYDLNRDQLLDLVQAVPPQWLEIVIHQHMPMFHMEHCVFCAVMSPGTNKTNCGRPCDVHVVELRDRTGIDHPLVADVGCRNTLFNAVPQSSSEIVSDLRTQGIRNFRIELLRESREQVAETVCLYDDLLSGRISGPQVWRSLNAANQVGVTRGTLESRGNPLAIL